MKAKTKEGCRLKRPRYFPDQLLTAVIMTAEQDYHRQQQWQHNRSLLGSGIVHGLKVGKSSEKESEGCINVGPGLAIDQWGRMLEVGPKQYSVCLKDTVCPGDPEPEPGTYALFMHYAERTWPVLPDPHCPPNDREAGWMCSGVRFSLNKCCEKSNSCTCPEVDCCLDACEYVCVRQGSADGCVKPDPDLDHCMELPPPLCERPDGWLWDPKAGIALACVEICKVGDREQCNDDYSNDEYSIRIIDPHPCDVRRHIFRNRQLFELIQECHISRPRLEPLTWLPQWDSVSLSTMSWEDFKCNCLNGFSLRFTRPLCIDGFHEASVFITARTQDNLDYWISRRLPLKIDPCEKSVHDGKEYAREIRLSTFKKWKEAELEGYSTLLEAASNFQKQPERRGLIIEVTLRSAMMRDACGTMLDARPPGMTDGPEHTRNGDDLVIAFRVEVQSETPYQAGDTT